MNKAFQLQEVTLSLGYPSYIMLSHVMQLEEIKEGLQPIIDVCCRTWKDSISQDAPLGTMWALFLTVMDSPCPGM
jgi:hypothetical protein